MVSGIFFRNFRNRKIVKVELNGELFTIKFADGEVLSKLTIGELNHVIVTATGR